MFDRFKLTTLQLLNNPKARTIFILGTMALAALAGGAPNEYGGG